MMARWTLGAKRRRTSWALVASVVLLAPLIVGPESAFAADPTASRNSSGVPTTSRNSASHATHSCVAFKRFEADDFPHSTNITGKWFPLVPGTQFVYKGTVVEDGTSVSHRVVFTVTDLIKVIDGVPARVIWDVDYDGNQVAEAELAFFAQDDGDNVWTLGEYPEEYDNGKFAGAPSTWIQGERHARAGVLVPGHPQLGSPRFLQGVSRSIDFLDCAKVFAVRQRTCVPTGCYRGLLVMDENSPLDPDSGHQRKFYAPGVGVVRIGAVDDPQAETLVLTKIVHLGPGARAAANAAALKLDRHAYKVSKLYRATPRAYLP
jgi:hypothetical protein